MREEVDALLEKARRSFAAAELLLREGNADFAASRAYYGYFYVAEGLLLSKDLSFSRHTQVVSQYGLRFARTNLLDRRFHRLLVRAFAIRQIADYDAQADPDADEVRLLIEEGKSFLDAAREYLATPRESDPSASDRGANNTESF
ncbi:MAG: HEPN domain-containing protein [Actinobacteria bacterium]|nr:HEPN domain-containing protein [Actinomycetota bacterium]